MRHFNKLLTAAALTTMAATAAYGWGAIAVDDAEDIEPTEVGYGIVTASATRDAATTEALRLCKGEGNESCELVLTFQNCGAYAAGRAAFGTGTAMTLKDAEQGALAACGEKECKIVISDCE